MSLMFDPKVAGEAREAFLICLIRSTQTDLAATLAAALEVDLTARWLMPRPIFSAISTSGFNHHVRRWFSFNDEKDKKAGLKKRQTTMEWHRRLRGRDGYVLLRYLQGASASQIGRECNLSHTMINKFLSRFRDELSDDPSWLPPLVTTSMLARDKQDRPPETAKVAALVFAWRHGAQAMMFNDAEGVTRYLSWLLNSALDQRHADYGEWLVSLAMNGEGRSPPRVLWSLMQPTRAYQEPPLWTPRERHDLRGARGHGLHNER